MKPIERRTSRAALAALAVCTSIACTTVGVPIDPTVQAPPQAIEPDDADTIPCGPRRVLMAVCQRCHSRPPQNGAPFPLVTHADIVRVGPDGEIRQLMIEQIEAGRMPLSPVTIDYDSRETLTDWLAAGAPAEPPHACDADAGDADAARDASPRD